MILWPISPALPIPRDDDVPPALVHIFHRPAKLAIEPPGDFFERLAFQQNDLPAVAKLFELAQFPGNSKCFRAHCVVILDRICAE